jgi:SnoaL-like domain
VRHVDVVGNFAIDLSPFEWFGEDERGALDMFPSGQHPVASLTMHDDRAQIADVLIRYATGIDRRDWPLFRTCWTDEIDADYDTVGHFSTVDEITDAMTKIHANMGPTYHRMSNFAIDIDGGRATARSYVHAVLMLTAGDPNNWVDAIGHYEDVFVRTAEGWRIRSRISRTARVLTGGEAAAAAAAQAGEPS